jgi:hypothetical protein
MGRNSQNFWRKIHKIFDTSLCFWKVFSLNRTQIYFTFKAVIINLLSKKLIDLTSNKLDILILVILFKKFCESCPWVQISTMSCLLWLVHCFYAFTLSSFFLPNHIEPLNEFIIKYLDFNKQRKKKTAGCKILTRKLQFDF